MQIYTINRKSWHDHSVEYNREGATGTHQMDANSLLFVLVVLVALTFLAASSNIIAITYTALNSSVLFFQLLIPYSLILRLVASSISLLVGGNPAP